MAGLPANCYTLFYFTLLFKLINVYIICLYSPYAVVVTHMPLHCFSTMTTANCMPSFVDGGGWNDWSLYKVDPAICNLSQCRFLNLLADVIFCVTFLHITFQMYTFDLCLVGNCASWLLQHSVHFRTGTWTCIADYWLGTQRML